MKTLTAAFLLFLGHLIYAQNNVDKLIDSLSFEVIPTMDETVFPIS